LNMATPPDRATVIERSAPGVTFTRFLNQRDG
jgi:hypothetical protein